MISRIILALICLISLPVFAQQVPPSMGATHRTLNLDGNGNPFLNSATMNVKRSFLLPNNVVRGFANLTLWVDYSHANNGIITIVCSAARDQKTGTPSPLFAIGICDVKVDGSCTLKDGAVINRTVTSSTRNRFAVTIGVLGHGNTSCDVSHSAGSASDKITINADLVTR